MIDFSKVKLIVTDMDGSLLHSDYSLNPEFFEIYQQLKDFNILFSVASGRQYDSLAGTFQSIKNEIYFIAENGGYVIYKDNPIITREIDRKVINEVVEICRPLPGTEMLLCGTHNAYVEKSSPKFAEHIIPYYPKNKTVSDLTENIDDQIVKVAIYNADGSEQNILPYIKHLEENYQVSLSGIHWLDISTKISNKGTALQKVQDLLSISKDETMVFGDYMNDLEMMKQAYFSFAMQNAHPDLKAVAKFETDTNNNDGVLKIIKEVIRQRKNK